MEQVVIQVRSKEKARLLSELLSALDFVEMVTTERQEPDVKESSENDFFALAGIWEGRQVDLDTIRQQAWPRQAV